jgi:hypothetical protein
MRTTSTPLSTVGPIASRLAALGLLSLAGCAPIESGETTGEPIVGRLQFNDRVIDLTPSAFADGPNSVPKDAVGHIIADIDLRETPLDGTGDTRKRGAAIDDDGTERGKRLRRGEANSR